MVERPHHQRSELLFLHKDEVAVPKALLGKARFVVGKTGIVLLIMRDIQKTPPKMNKRLPPFQKDSLSSNHNFSGDMLVLHITYKACPLPVLSGVISPVAHLFSAI